MEPTPQKGKKGLMATILVVVVLIVVAIILINKKGSDVAPVDATALATPFTTASSTFSIQFPEGWQTQDGGQFGAVVFAVNPVPSEDGKAKFATNMNVTTEVIKSGTLDDYLSATLEALPKFLTNYKTTVDKTLTVGGVSARLIGGTFSQGELKLQNLQLITIKDGAAYVVTATSLESAWDQYKDILEASLMTFLLK